MSTPASLLDRPTVMFGRKRTVKPPGNSAAERAFKQAKVEARWQGGSFKDMAHSVKSKAEADELRETISKTDASPRTRRQVEKILRSRLSALAAE